MNQSITTWKAYEILHNSFPSVKEETIAVLARSGELEVYRVGSVNRVSLDEIQRVLQSWREQEAEHMLLPVHRQTISVLKQAYASHEREAMQ